MLAHKDVYIYHLDLSFRFHHETIQQQLEIVM